MPLLAPRAKSTTRKRTVNTVITIAAIALAALVLVLTADAIDTSRSSDVPPSATSGAAADRG